MAAIKSLDDLRKIRADVQARMTLRKRNIPDQLVQIKVAMATCGIASGAKTVIDYIRTELDKRNIEAVVTQTGCMGYCYAEPTIEVTAPGKDPLVFGYVDTKRVDQIIEKYIKNGELVEGIIPVNYEIIEEHVFEDHKIKSPLYVNPETKESVSDSKHMGIYRKQLRIALRNCGFIDPENIDEYIGRNGYRALGRCITEMTPEQVIELMKKSGLRGRGGGGFPSGLKWEITRASKADQKYVVCNADEGDPGAFMDRSILEGDPHSVIEAMAICGYCIDGSKGLVYIRAEYPLAIERLKTALNQARESGLLGSNILGTDFTFDIELRYGAGAFVCGEETALIHSMEGLRGEPNVKPPFPSVSGYLGRPTNVNNVETFANVPVIINQGAEWFANIGSERSKGTKVFALAGKINNVGLIEVPMGITLREVIFEIGGGIKDGKKFKAVQTGGPSGGCLTKKHLDTPIDYDNLVAAGSMMGSGGMIVLDEEDCMVSIAKFYLDFTVEESCGKCAPCRIGNKRLIEILDKICKGDGTMEDLDNLRNLSHVIKDTSLCGLGQTSPNPVLSTMENFYDEYLAHIVDKKCPSGQCKALLQYIIEAENCVGCTACARNCPVNAISGERKGIHVIDQAVCIKCGACMEKCKFNAVFIQ